MSKKQKSLAALRDGVLSAAGNAPTDDRQNAVKQLVNVVLTENDEKKRARAVRKIVNKNAEIKRVFDENPEIIKTEIEKALLELASGSTIKEETITVSGGRKTVKTVVKYLPPNQTAIEFYLTNKGDYSRTPDSQSADGKKTDEIMEALKNVK